MSTVATRFHLGARAWRSRCAIAPTITPWPKTKSRPPTRGSKKRCAHDFGQTSAAARVDVLQRLQPLDVLFAVLWAAIIGWGLQTGIVRQLGMLIGVYGA